ncbi:hypothetical protein ABKV19_013778 [Rosa sericea]
MIVEGKLLTNAHWDYGLGRKSRAERSTGLLQEFLNTAIFLFKHSIYLSQRQIKILLEEAHASQYHSLLDSLSLTTSML